MSWSTERSSGNERAEGARSRVELGAPLGASAVCLVLLGVLSLLAAKDLEPFGGSVSVLAGLLAGAALVVAGLTGVAPRHVTPGRDRTTGQREQIETRSVDAGSWLDDGGGADWVGATRMMRAIQAPPPPPPPPVATSRSAPPRSRTTSSRTGSRPLHIPDRSSSRTSA